MQWIYLHNRDVRVHLIALRFVLAATGPYGVGLKHTSNKETLNSDLRWILHYVLPHDTGPGST